MLSEPQTSGSQSLNSGLRADLRWPRSIPHGRWTASGQGDPEAEFANFQGAQDPHPKVSLYLHHRLESLRAGLAPDDLASMDGMVSRLIRVDAISDNGNSNKRGGMLLLHAGLA